MMMSPVPRRLLFRLMWTALTVMLEEPGALLTCCSFRMTVIPAIGPIVVFGAGLAASVIGCCWGSPSVAPTSVVDPVEPELVEVQVLLISWAVSRDERRLTSATEALLVAEPAGPVVPWLDTCRTPAVRTDPVIGGTVTDATESLTLPPLEGSVTVGSGPDVMLARLRGVTFTLSPKALPLTLVTSAPADPPRVTTTRAAPTSAIAASTRKERARAPCDCSAPVIPSTSTSATKEGQPSRRSDGRAGQEGLLIAAKNSPPQTHTAATVHDQKKGTGIKRISSPTAAELQPPVLPVEPAEVD